jgi:hypothetical protein
MAMALCGYWYDYRNSIYTTLLKTAYEQQCIFFFDCDSNKALPNMLRQSQITHRSLKQWHLRSPGSHLEHCSLLSLTMLDQ